VPVGSPADAALKLPPPFDDRAMLSAYWPIAYMIFGSDQSKSTVAPSPPRIIFHTVESPTVTCIVPLSCVPPIVRFAAVGAEP
jgi:hypothetical protein